MIIFSQRKMIADAFNEWADLRGLAKTPIALVSFLEIEGCLDEDAVFEKFPIEPPQTIYYPQVDGVTPTVVAPKEETE